MWGAGEGFASRSRPRIASCSCTKGSWTHAGLCPQMSACALASFFALYCFMYSAKNLFVLSYTILQWTCYFCNLYFWLSLLYLTLWHYFFFFVSFFKLILSFIRGLDIYKVSVLMTSPEPPLLYCWYCITSSLKLLI